MKKLLWNAILNSLGVGVYIIIAALIIRNGNKLFASDGLTAIIGALTFMTISVAIVGSLIFVKPVMFYLDNKKKESVQLLIYTIAVLAILLAIYLLILALI
jgi:hypothetical protein